MAQQQGQGADNSMGPIWTALGVMLIGALIWFVAHQYIVAFVFFLTNLQAKLMYFFVGGTELANDIYIMDTVDPASVELAQLDTLMAGDSHSCHLRVRALSIGHYTQIQACAQHEVAEDARATKLACHHACC